MEQTTLFINALVFHEDGIFRPGTLRIKGDTILELGKHAPLPGETVIDCGGNKLLPGFLDLHTHGRAGGDFSSADREEYDRMAVSYAALGITSLLATTMTLPKEKLEQVFSTLGEWLCTSGYGSRILGINMEGPFLSEEKRGAHDKTHLLPPNPVLFSRLNKLSGGKIRLVSIAPELDGAIPFIRETSQHCVVAVAHTAADYDTVSEAFQAGAKNVTHLYNALSPFGHREPGAVGAAFDSDAYAELICDGIHLHPAAIRTAFRLFGPERICLISDSMSAAGLSDGEYALGGQRVTVKGHKATLADGTIAGSVTDVAQAVRFCVNCGIPQSDAIKAATITPAKLIGCDAIVGSLTPGKKADLLITDPALHVKQVFVGGREILTVLSSL